jgi:NAD(P)H-hydrate repair Nnr-like enzyme with NAD(P)H-hydrate dehydratase domain
MFITHEFPEADDADRAALGTGTDRVRVRVGVRVVVTVRVRVMVHSLKPMTLIEQPLGQVLIGLGLGLYLSLL